LLDIVFYVPVKRVAILSKLSSCILQIIVVFFDIHCKNY